MGFEKKNGVRKGDAGTGKTTAYGARKTIVEDSEE